MDIGNTALSPDLQNIDIYAAVGANAAYDRTVSGVTVTTGTLNIQSVYGSADDPEVAAIEVIPTVTGPPSRDGDGAHRRGDRRRNDDAANRDVLARDGRDHDHALQLHALPRRRDRRARDRQL